MTSPRSAEARLCTVEDCVNPYLAKGLCRNHYNRQRERGTTAPAYGKNGDGCEYPGCERLSKAKSLCNVHYNRSRRGRMADHQQHRLPVGSSAIRDGLGRKRCRDCECWLGESNFVKAINNSDGLINICKDCKRLYDAAQTLYFKYKLTTDDVVELIHRQGGICPVCLLRITAEGFTVDHDHDCCPTVRTCGNCVRGILHMACNSGIGYLGDSADNAERAARYLRNWSVNKL